MAFSKAIHSVGIAAVLLATAVIPTMPAGAKEVPKPGTVLDIGPCNKTPPTCFVITRSVKPHRSEPASRARAIKGVTPEPGNRTVYGCWRNGVVTVAGPGGKCAKGDLLVTIVLKD